MRREEMLKLNRTLNISGYKIFSNCEYSSIKSIQPMLYLKQDIVSFKEANTPSQKTMAYIQKMQEEYKAHGRNLNSLTQLDLSQISDICKGITVFKDWSVNDLAIASNKLDTIMLNRGCYKQCIHCGGDSSPKISFMHWNDYTQLIDGFAQLQERLGFNPFNPMLNLYPYHDSDPVDYKSTDINGKAHNIYDASQYIYDKIGLKFVISTAGWDPKNNITQKAMENIVNNSEISNGICISIHPFHILMDKSRKDMLKGDIKKSNEYKEKYITMMANVLKTLAPLLQENKFCINLEFTSKIPGYTKEDSLNLLEEIFNKVDTKPADFTIYRLKKEGIITFTDIAPIGRAKTLLGIQNNIPIMDLKFDPLTEGRKSINIDGRILSSNPYFDFNIQHYELPMRLNFTHNNVDDPKYIYPKI